MIETRTRSVYYSTRRRRHFLTAEGAAKAEASARMSKAFPSDGGETDDMGRRTWDPWCWRDVPRLVAIYDRLVKRYMAAIKSERAK